MKKIGIHLLICLLLSSPPTWAYVPLKGLSQDTINSPVVARSVTNSMAEQDGKLNSDVDPIKRSTSRFPITLQKFSPENEVDVGE
jgi:hypothetical protein